MAFLTPAQLKTHIYPGVSTAISKGDVTILPDAIEAAIAEAKGYCSRYRIEQLFDNVDVDPAWKADAILLMHVKSLAKWHFIALANPNIDYEEAQVRYNLAIDWLTKVQSGKFVPDNWPPITPDEKSTFFHIKSNPKRLNHFN